MNNINLVGRVVRQNELRASKSGKMVLNNTVAVDRPYSTEDETDFINFVAWEKTAEFIAKYSPKGGRIALSGRLQARNYEDKDGKPRTAYEVVVERVTPIDWIEQEAEEVFEESDKKQFNRRTRK